MSATIEKQQKFTAPSMEELENLEAQAERIGAHDLAEQIGLVVSQEISDGLNNGTREYYTQEEVNTLYSKLGI